MLSNSLEPLFGNNTTKSAIIQSLTERPLTLKELHTIVTQNTNKNITYQAIHKSVKEMIDEHIIQKDGKKLKIGYDFIRKTKMLGQRLEDSIKETYEQEVSNFSFNSIVELGRFLINTFLAYPNPENKDFVCYWNHAYPLAGVSQEEHEMMKKMFKLTKHSNICANNTFLDKMTGEYLEKLGKDTTLCAKMTTKVDTFVNGEYIMQVYLSPETEKEFDTLYKSVKSEKDINMQKLFEFSSKKREINVIVTKNKTMAEKIRQEAIQIIKKNKE